MQVLQFILDGLSLGGILAISALGVGLLYGVLQLINFAYGDFITLAAYSLVVPSVAAASTLMFGALPWPLLILAVVATVSVAVLIAEYTVFRPLRTADPSTLMIASFALGYVIQNLVLMFYSGRPKSLNLWPQLNEVVEFAGLRMTILQPVTIAVTALLLVALVLFLKKSEFGIALRAAAEDFETARVLGVKANTVISIAFVRAAVSARRPFAAVERASSVDCLPVSVEGASIRRSARGIERALALRGRPCGARASAKSRTQPEPNRREERGSLATMRAMPDKTEGSDKKWRRTSRETRRSARRANRCCARPRSRTALPRSSRRY
ncbi:MAG: branched-chain amino acid ABC transporter permease [Rhizobiaceae bacterium]